MKTKKVFLNLIFKITIIFSLGLIISCSPQTKDSYLEDYGYFMSDISNDENNYTEEEWLEIDEEYEKYSGELYEQFQEDLTLKEEIILTKYTVQYKLLRFKADTSGLMNLFNKKDFVELKEQLKYYSENNMTDDIKSIIKEADEIGSEASKAIEDILKELNINEANIKE